jgi:hypothetical protein
LKKNKTGEITLFDLEIFTAVVMETVTEAQSQINKTKNQQQSSKQDQLILTKQQKQQNVRETTFSTDGARATGYPEARAKQNPDLHLLPSSEINFMELSWA